MRQRRQERQRYYDISQISVDPVRLRERRPTQVIRRNMVVNRIKERTAATSDSPGRSRCHAQGRRCSLSTSGYFVGPAALRLACSTERAGWPFGKCQPPPGMVVRGGSRSRPKPRCDHRLPADPIDQDGICSPTGLGVHDYNAWPLWSEVLVTPGKERPEHRAEIAPALGQPVFVMWRMVAIGGRVGFSPAVYAERFGMPRA